LTNDLYDSFTAQSCTRPLETRFPLTSSCHFFFKNTATTDIYTLSLHDALPILLPNRNSAPGDELCDVPVLISFSITVPPAVPSLDRKSTRLNSSHSQISYAVFCLKKKKYEPRKATLFLSGWPSFRRSACSRLSA